MERSFLDGGNENPDIPLRKEYFTSPSNSISLLEKYHIEIDKNLDVLSVDTDWQSDDFWTTREIFVAGYLSYR